MNLVLTGKARSRAKPGAQGSGGSAQSSPNFQQVKFLP